MVSGIIQFILVDIDSIFLTVINFVLLVFFHFFPLLTSYLVVQFVIREYCVLFCSESIFFIEFLFVRWEIFMLLAWTLHLLSRCFLKEKYFIRWPFSCVVNSLFSKYIQYAVSSEGRNSVKAKSFVALPFPKLTPETVFCPGK